MGQRSLLRGNQRRHLWQRLHQRRNLRQSLSQSRTTLTASGTPGTKNTTPQPWRARHWMILLTPCPTCAKMAERLAALWAPTLVLRLINSEHAIKSKVWAICGGWWYVCVEGRWTLLVDFMLLRRSLVFGDSNSSLWYWRRSKRLKGAALELVPKLHVGVWIMD